MEWLSRNREKESVPLLEKKANLDRGGGARDCNFYVRAECVRILSKPVRGNESCRTQDYQCHVLDKNK